MTKLSMLATHISNPPSLTGRRAILVCSMVILLCASGVGFAHAAGRVFVPYPSATQRVWNDVPASRTWRSETQFLLKLLTHSQRSAPHVRLGAPSRALQIPWSAFPKGTQGEKGGAISPSAADSANQNVFADNTFHRQSYSHHGMTGGYQQQASIVLNASGDNAPVFWLGSTYGTSQEAASRVDDAVSSLHRLGVTGQGCFLPDQSNCALFVFTPALGEDLIYLVWADGNTLGELLFAGSNRAMEQNQATVTRSFQSILPAADAVVVASAGGASPPTGPAAAVSAPTITLDGIAILRNVQGGLKPTTSTVYLHEIEDFTATFHMSGIGTYTPDAGFEFLYPHGRAQIVQAVKPSDTNPSTTKVIYDQPAGLAFSPSGAQFFDTIGSFEDPSAVGKFTVQFTVTLGASSDSMSKTFTLKLGPPTCKKGYKVKNGACVKAKLR